MTTLNSKTAPTQTVLELGQMNFDGNVIPEQWYSNIRMKDGKPDLPAIIILADIVYWYRPKEVRDERTAKFSHYEKKFHGDILQRSYATLQEKFGLSRDQCDRAINNLKNIGVISLVFRTITVDGTKVPNVMYIDLHADRLIEITVNGIHVPFKQDTPTVKTGDVSGLNGGRIPFKPVGPHYNTKITTQITSENTTERENATALDFSRNGKPRDTWLKALGVVRRIYDERIIPIFEDKLDGSLGDINHLQATELAKFIERGVDDQGMEAMADILVGAYERYCGDEFWVNKGCPFEKFVQHFAKYTTSASKSRAKEQAKPKRPTHMHGLAICDDPDCTRTDEEDGLGHYD